jgi:membrane protease YdiL (CAAX protease family)
MELFLERKHIGKEVLEDEKEPATLGKIAYYTVIALFGIFLIGYAINLVPLTIPAALTGTDAILYSVLIGIAEEQFFRGFLTDWLLSVLPSWIMAVSAGAGIFAVYHFARYGTQLNALVYVFAGGFILGWVAYKSRRLSPTMIAHAANNTISYLKGSVMAVALTLMKLLRA